MHTPAASIRWTQQLLETLDRRGLAQRASGPRRRSLWFATVRGADTTRSAGTLAEPRRHIVTAAQAVGPLRAHTLAVNDAGLAFVNAARERPEDECGPLSWRHEIAHPYRPGRGRNGAHLVIADALLSYLQATDDSLVLRQRFVELDRGTIPCEVLAEKLARYSQLRRFTGEATARPLWREHYRDFPVVLVVLADQDAEATRRRIQRAIALLRSDHTNTRGEAAPVSFTALSDLTMDGPFAPIFISAEQPDHYHGWLDLPRTEPNER
ncbi:MAG TPA: replication-relaxation family protein [Solirubrobacteraceae bacterium]